MLSTFCPLLLKTILKKTFPNTYFLISTFCSDFIFTQATHKQTRQEENTLGCEYVQLYMCSYATAMTKNVMLTVSETPALALWGEMSSSRGGEHAPLHSKSLLVS